MTTVTAGVTTGAVEAVTPISLGQRFGDTRDDPLVESEEAEEKRNCPFFSPDRTGSSPGVTSAVLHHRGCLALGSIHIFATFHRLRWEPVECTSMIENFSYISTGSLLARPEPPSDLIPIPIPIPVFRPAVPVEENEPAPIEGAILQELAEIKREVRALRAQGGPLNASAVALESAMAMLGCKRSQVFKLLEERRLARASKVGRAVMITVASIEALLAEPVLRRGKKLCSRGARCAPNNMKARSPRPENTGVEKSNPGGAIRKIPID